MVDLSVYQRYLPLSEAQKANEAQNLQNQLVKAQTEKAQKLAASGGGSTPAALQIADRMFNLEKVYRNPNANPEEREAALREYNLIGQAAKTYGFDRLTEYGMPQGQFPAGVELPAENVTAEVTNKTQPRQFENLDAIMAEMGTPQSAPPSLPPVFQDMPQIREVGGYSDLMAQREAKKASATEEAKLRQQLEYEPQIKREGASAAAQGKVEGERIVSLQEARARAPQLMNMVGRLSQLGNAATYTLAGQARDMFIRQMGRDVPDSAVARREYVSMVDNEILPLLRQTFGAQFTEREGQSLKATLGDVNASPREKDAVLRSFIRTKMEDINTQSRMVGQDQPFDQNMIDQFVGSVGQAQQIQQAPQQLQKGTVEDGYMYLGGDPSNPKSWKKAQ